MREFIKQLKTTGEGGATHPYIFQNMDDPNLLQPTVDRLAPLTTDIPWMPTQRLQFYLGPALSGAPLHYHSDAINILAHGTKHWYLQSPDQAEYHTTPTHQWDGANELSQSDKLIECTQQAGDVLYVPAGWGHATLNWQESVGVAVEYTLQPQEITMATKS